MLPFKPSTAALRRVFSLSSRFVRGFWAFSAPDVWLGGQYEVLKDTGRELTPISTGTEKKSRPVSLAIASPPGIPGR
jgi:hypothetical protein